MKTKTLTLQLERLLATVAAVVLFLLLNGCCAPRMVYDPLTDTRRPVLPDECVFLIWSLAP